MRSIANNVTGNAAQTPTAPLINLSNQLFRFQPAIVPSKIERNEVLVTDSMSGKMIDLFQKTCKPYGNFPSMHVALSVPVVGINFMVAGPIAGSITLVWGILIAISTLYTKQHYILDVLAGLIGGVLISALTYWLMMG